LGTNPKAIETIVAVLGFDNVHFLEELHSKIYIGQSEAVIGSCNLTDNGLSDVGLKEAAIHISDRESIEKLNLQFESYRDVAIKQFPTKASKLSRLRSLFAQWRENSFKKSNFELDDVPSLNQYTSNLDRVHVVWYDAGDFKYNTSAFEDAIPNLTVTSLNDYFSEGMQFLESDDVKVGDWLLCWNSDANGLPRKGGSISWMCVHNVVPYGAEDEDSSYTKFVGKVSSLSSGSQPFKLDGEVKAAIRKALCMHEFKLLRCDNYEDWKTNLKLSRKLIDFVKASKFK
jgi:hypothetical protein